jgi:hypothetical protein
MLKNFLGRLLSQTIVQATGILGLLIAVVRDLWFPNVNPLPYYLVLLILSVVIGSFRVFADIQKEHEIARQDQDKKFLLLEQELAELKNNQPKLEIGVDLGDGELVKSLTTVIFDVKPLEDIDKLLEEKRKELSERFPERPKSSPSDSTGIDKWKIDISEAMGSLLSGITAQSGFDEYIDELRAFYLNSQKWELYHELGLLIFPIIKNYGPVTANSITLEFILPQKFILSDKNIRDEVYWYLTDEESKPVPPKEPTFRSLLSRQSPASRLGEFYIPAFDNLKNEPIFETGPIYSFENGKAIITYHCGKLLQGRLIDDLDPFLVWLGDLESPSSIIIQTNIFAEELRESPHVSELEIEVSFNDFDGQNKHD